MHRTVSTCAVYIVNTVYTKRVCNIYLRQSRKKLPLFSDPITYKKNDYTIYNKKYFSDDHFSYIVRVIT